MNKHIPAILLAIISTVLAIGLYRSNREITTLEGKIAELERAPMPRPVEGSHPAKSPGLRGGDASPGAIVGTGVQPAEESAVDGAGPASRRMMSSQMTQQLEDSEAPLSGETHRGLLEMMHTERKNFDFSTDLHDSEKMDVSAGRFSKENLRKFSDDMDQLNRSMVGKAKDLLTAGQLEAFEESVAAIAEMQKSQMEMAGNMFRSGEE